MYSSMHSPGRGVNRIERTLLNFFMWGGVKCGCFGVPGRCFAGDFRAAARREWAVLPRNSGVFGLGEGAARRFSARRTLLSRRGEKIFKKRGEKGEKLKNWGARGTERANLGTLYRTGSVLIDGRTSPHTSSLTYPLPSTTQSNLSVCVHSPRPSTLTLRLRMTLCRILVMTIPIRADRRPLCHRKIHQHPKASPLPQLISLPRTPTRLQIHHVYQ